MSGQVGSLATGGLEGLPSTIFINRSGKVVRVHTGQYVSGGGREGDIETDAVGG